jgi:hypothetical protein
VPVGGLTVDSAHLSPSYARSHFWRASPYGGFSASGRRLWRDTLSAYELHPAEHQLLLAACRSLTELERVERELATGPLMVTGSTGQPVPNPLLAEVRAHRKTVETLLRSLALPVEGETQGRVRSPAARDAARARWRRDELRPVGGLCSGQVQAS